MYCSLSKHRYIWFFSFDDNMIVFMFSSLISTHLLLLGINNDDFISLVSVSVVLS